MVILVPIDDGPHREQVLDVAISMGRDMGQPLYVVHLVESNSANVDAKRVRDEIRDRVADAGVPVTVALEHVGRRSPRSGTRTGQNVLELASDVDITHIVMGHRSKGLLAELTQGSAAFSVADHAQVPVTIVPETLRDR